MKKLSNWFNEKILFIGVVVLLVFIPLYPKFPLFNIPNTYVAVRFEDLLVSFLVFFFLLKVVREKTNIFKGNINRLIIAYFVVGALSVINAIFITKVSVPHLTFLHWFRRLEYMSLFFVVVASIKKIQDVKDYLISISFALVGVIVYGIGQKFFSFPVVSTMNEEFSKGYLLVLNEWARVSSTFAGHYDLGAYLVMILAIIIALIFAIDSIWKKILAVFLWIFALYLLILTAAQTSFVAYLVSMIIVLSFLKKFIWIIPFVLISFILMFSSSELSQRYAATYKVNLSFLSGIYTTKTGGIKEPTIVPTPTLVTEEETPAIVIKTPTITPTATVIKEKKYIDYSSTEPVDAVELTAYRSSKIRFNVEWPRALRAFYKDPIIGTGFASITLATDNDYLRTLGETGFLGFLTLSLIFLALFIFSVKYIMVSHNKFGKVMAVGFIGAMAGFLVNAVFIDVLESSKVAYTFWMFMGIMIGIIKLESNEK